MSYDLIRQKKFGHVLENASYVQSGVGQRIGLLGILTALALWASITLIAVGVLAPLMSRVHKWRRRNAIIMATAFGLLFVCLFIGALWLAPFDPPQTSSPVTNIFAWSPFDNSLEMAVLQHAPCGS